MAYGVATNNPFDLLGDDDDPVQVIAAAPVAEPKEVVAPKKQNPPKENKPVKTAEVEAPPAAKGDNRKGGKGKGGGRGYPRDDADGDVTPYGKGGKGGYGKGKGKGGKGGYSEGGKGGNSGGGGDGEERRPRREYDRRSGSGKGGEVKRGGSGRGNWGSTAEEINSEKPSDPVDGVDGEKPVDSENPPVDGEEKVDTDAPEAPKEEEQDNEMTLEEYEKANEAKKLEFKNKFAKAGEGRQTSEAEYASLAKVEKVDIMSENTFSGLEKTKANKTAGIDKTLKTKETVETNFHIPRDDGYAPRKGKGDGRKGGGDRKGGYGGRGDRRGKGQAPISIADTEAFPTLPGAKAK